MIVESAGGAESPVDASMQSLDDRRIAILLLTDERSESITNLILRAVGKRPRGVIGSRSSSWNQDHAMRWLLAEEVDDIYVGAAERLTSQQLTDLLMISREARVWLLYSERCVHRDHFLMEPSAMGETTKRNVRRRCTTSSSSAPDWSDFPALPRDEPLMFRSRCKMVLDPLELERVDMALEIGAQRAFEAFAGTPPTAQSVAKCGFELEVPMWPALAMLRGAQLAAFMHEWELTFDLDRWMQIRSTIPTLDPRAIATIRESPDSRDGTLTAIRTISQAEVRAIAAMKVMDVSSDGTSFYCSSNAHDVPVQLRSVFRAYLLERDGSPGSPLFVDKDEDAYPVFRLRRLIRKAQLRFGLPGYVHGELDRKFEWEAGDLKSAVNLRLTRLALA